jgi:NADH-quinone oxidoreductase subunit A
MPDNYFVRYVPFLIHLGVAFALAGALVLLSQFLGRHRYSRAKFQPYECGMTPVGDARQRFSVKFYLVAMLFILFDVEAVFLYPWAILLKELRMFGFWEMVVYIGIVLVGLFYVWKKGVLDWGETGQVRVGVSSMQPELVASMTAARPQRATPELLKVGEDKS